MDTPEDMKSPLPTRSFLDSPIAKNQKSAKYQSASLALDSPSFLTRKSKFEGKMDENEIWADGGTCKSV